MSYRVLEKFFNRVEQEQRYLAYGDHSFEELLKRSMKDRRVRNVFVFYVLSNKEFYNKFLILSERKYTVQRLRSSLYKALQAVEKNNINRTEVRNLAKELRSRYFQQLQVVNYSEQRKLDESKEMEKFFVSVANHLVNENEVDPEKDAYVASKMKEVDFDNLFVSH